MNILQRIILVVGAIVLGVVLYMTPSYLQDPKSGLRVKVTNPVKGILGKKDTGRAAINGSIVIGSTALLYFAAKSRKGKQGDGNGSS